MKKIKFSGILVLLAVFFLSGCTKRQDFVNQNNSTGQSNPAQENQLSQAEENSFPTSTPEQKRAAEESMEKTKNAIGVVDSFMISLNSYLSSKGEPNSADLALSQLSEGAKSRVPMVADNYQLEKFLKIEKTPLENYEITAVTFSNNPATGDPAGLAKISVVLKYSQKEEGRIFLLSKTEAGWKIDGVETQEVNNSQQ